MSAPLSSSTEVWIVNPETGKRECYGVVYQRRQVGAWTLLLSWDESMDIWWITPTHPTKPMTQAGFIAKVLPHRREDAWHYFFEITEHELDHPED